MILWKMFLLYKDIFRWIAGLPMENSQFPDYVSTPCWNCSQNHNLDAVAV